MLKTDDAYLNSLMETIAKHKESISTMEMEISDHKDGIMYLEKKIRYSQKLIKEIVKITGEK